MEHRNPMQDDGANRIHVAHTLMGLIALGRNDLSVAKESLLSSAEGGASDSDHLYFRAKYAFGARATKQR